MTDTAWGGRGAERAAFFQEAGLTCLLIHCFPLCQQRQTHSLSGLVFPVTCEVRAHPQQLRGGSGSHTPSCPELRNWTSFSARPVMGPPGPSAPLGSPLVFPVHKDVPFPKTGSREHATCFTWRPTGEKAHVSNQSPTAVGWSSQGRPQGYPHPDALLS